jgi:hypothetical protein
MSPLLPPLPEVAAEPEPSAILGPDRDSLIPSLRNVKQRARRVCRNHDFTTTRAPRVARATRRAAVRPARPRAPVRRAQSRGPESRALSRIVMSRSDSRPSAVPISTSPSCATSSRVNSPASTACTRSPLWEACSQASQIPQFATRRSGRSVTEPPAPRARARCSIRPAGACPSRASSNRGRA